MEEYLFKLQKEIEKNPQKISEITDEDLCALNNLLEKQIEDLEKKINGKKDEFKALIENVKKLQN